MIAKVLQGVAVDTQQKLYAHYDYFGYIIPSTWFVLGIVCVEIYFYDGAVLVSILSALRSMFADVASPSTSFEVLFAIVAFVVAFNTVYILGHLLNGVSALVLDRIIVRKLLKYPFELYERKRQDSTSTASDHQIFRTEVYGSSYLILCANLIPWIFLEITLLVYEIHGSNAVEAITDHLSYSLVAAGGLVVLHFGMPRLKYVRRIGRATEGTNDGAAFQEIRLCHVIFAIVFAGLIGIFIHVTDSISWVFVFPLLNLILAAVERARPSETSERVLLYAKWNVLNLLYFGANLVSYGRMPARDVIGLAHQEVGSPKSPSDFFWLSYLALQTRAASAYQTAYHFLSMYSMNRNLSNATALVLVYSLGRFLVRAPSAPRITMFLWCVAASLLVYVFFLRYLYIYSSYFSRFLVRTVALLGDVSNGSRANAAMSLDECPSTTP